MFLKLEGISYHLCNDNCVNVLFDICVVYVNNQRTNDNLLVGGVMEGLYKIQLDNKHIHMTHSGVKAPLATQHALLGHNNERKTKELV